MIATCNKQFEKVNPSTDGALEAFLPEERQLVRPSHVASLKKRSLAREHQRANFNDYTARSSGELGLAACYQPDATTLLPHPNRTQQHREQYQRPLTQGRNLRATI